MGAPTGDPSRHGSRGTTAFDTTFRALRAAGLLIAWGCAVACGWKIGRQSDLLDAVLHGAIAWAGVIGLWFAALAIIQSSFRSDSAARPAEPLEHEVAPPG